MSAPTEERLHAEVLVVGGGPAGMAAATAAARHGRQVLLLDDNRSTGGQIWREGIAQTTQHRDAVETKTVAALRSSGARVLTGWRIFDAPHRHTLRALEESEAQARTADISFDQLILATGARERFLPFPGWTLPGVFGAGGLQALVRGGYSIAGKRVIVAGSGPLLLPVAAHLRQMGARVATVAEQASKRQLAGFTLGLARQPGKLLQGMHYRAAAGGSRYRTGCWPVAAIGHDTLEGLRLSDGRRTWNQACDLLACGFHLVPNTELVVLLGCALWEGFVACDALQRTSVPGVFAAGEITAIAGLESALLSGEIAGLAAAGAHAEATALLPRRRRMQTFATRLAAAFALRPELRTLAQPETIVCRCEDVSYASLQRHTSWTMAKLQTRCGMGPCQGRICGPATETLFGWRAGSVRPPLFPVPLSALNVGRAAGIP